MATIDALYRLEQVRHRYGDRLVLDLAALEVMRGETLAIAGPSGAGKSTLLRLLQFLERPTSGRLWFDGAPVDGAPSLQTRRRVATVFQRPVVLSRSVRANLAYGRRVRGLREDRRETAHLLEALGLAPLAGAPARSLSGGETQRVAFGCAMACRPDVLLLDEPTANLDPRNVRLVEVLLHERKMDGVTVVLATHQIFQARRLADRAALLLDGQLVEIGPTARLFDDPRDPRTRAFLTGDMIY
jgi:tungstate transport system ATP-binding protein